MDILDKLRIPDILPNAHKCYKGIDNYELVLGYGSFVCSMCRDPHKSIDLVLSKEELEKLREEEKIKVKGEEKWI